MNPLTRFESTYLASSPFSVSSNHHGLPQSITRSLHQSSSGEDSNNASNDDLFGSHLTDDNGDQLDSVKKSESTVSSKSSTSDRGTKQYLLGKSLLLNTEEETTKLLQSIENNTRLMVLLLSEQMELMKQNTTDLHERNVTSVLNLRSKPDEKHDAVEDVGSDVQAAHGDDIVEDDLQPPVYGLKATTTLDGIRRNCIRYKSGPELMTTVLVSLLSSVAQQISANNGTVVEEVDADEYKLLMNVTQCAYPASDKILPKPSQALFATIAAMFNRQEKHQVVNMTCASYHAMRSNPVVRNFFTTLESYVTQYLRRIPEVLPSGYVEAVCRLRFPRQIDDVPNAYALRKQMSREKLVKVRVNKYMLSYVKKNCMRSYYNRRVNDGYKVYKVITMMADENLLRKSTPSIDSVKILAEQEGRRYASIHLDANQ